jgi:putative ABC transport system permease protein
MKLNWRQFVDLKKRPTKGLHTMVMSKLFKREASIERTIARGVVLIVVFWLFGLLSQVLAESVDPRNQIAARKSDPRPTEPTVIEVRSVVPATAPQRAVEKPGRTIDVGLRYIELDRLKNDVPAIKRAVPIRELPMRISRPGRILDGTVVATTHDYAGLSRFGIKQGRFLTDADNTRCRSYAVLGPEAALTLFPSENPLGQSVSLGSDSFTVIGVARQEASGVNRLDSRPDIYVPLDTAKARFGEWTRKTHAERTQTFQLSLIVLELRTDANAQETVPLINSILKPFHHGASVEVVVAKPGREAE